MQDTALLKKYVIDDDIEMGSERGTPMQDDENFDHTPMQGTPMYPGFNAGMTPYGATPS